VSRFQIAYLPTVYHIREGKLRNISDERSNMIKYASQKGWEQISPVSAFFTPYSPLGDALAVIGSLGFKMLEGIDWVSAKTGVSPNLLIAAGMVLFFVAFYSLLARLLGPRAPKARPKKTVTIKED